MTSVGGPGISPEGVARERERRELEALRKARPWEQQDREPMERFMEFRTYLNLAPWERSPNAAYRRHHGYEIDDVSAQASGTWRDDMRRWKWQERALAWDREQDRIVYAKLAGRRVKSLVEVADLGETLRKKAAQAARMLSAVTQKIGEHEGKDVILMEVNLTPDQIVRFAEAGTKIEQLALGNPTDRQQIQGDPDNPLAITVETAKDALRKRLADIKARRDEAEREPVDEGPVAVVDAPEQLTSGEPHDAQPNDGATPVS